MSRRCVLRLVAVVVWCVVAFATVCCYGCVLLFLFAVDCCYGVVSVCCCHRCALVLFVVCCCNVSLRCCRCAVLRVRDVDC